MKLIATLFASLVALTMIAGDLRADEHQLEANKEIVRRFVYLINARDFDGLKEMLTPDFVRHSQATPQLLDADRDQFIEFEKQDLATFPDAKQTITQLVAEGDLVTLWGSYTGTQQQPMGPFPASNKQMQLDFAAMFRISGGKIAELWVIWDNLTALTQLGHFPPHEEAAKDGE